MSVIISLIFLILFIILLGSQLILNLRHPYLQPSMTLKTSDQLKLQRQARQQVTANIPSLNRLFIVSQATTCLGVILILSSVALVEAKLNLLIFPTRIAMISVSLLIAGCALLFFYPLLWPTQSYHYWTTHVTKQAAFDLADQATFTKYRRHQIWATIGGVGLIVTLWLARVWTTSTSPLVVIEYLGIALIVSMPILALITALVQLPYLYHYRYLKASTGRISFRRLNFRAQQALWRQQPELRIKLITAKGLRLFAFLLALGSLGILYVNIVAPAFTADPTAVFPAAIMALAAVCLLEAVDAIWPPRYFDYLQTLATKQLPFTVQSRDQFDRFYYHLTYYHLSTAIIWLAYWVAVIGAYYYFV
jgi:hypothetical protein